MKLIAGSIIACLAVVLMAGGFLKMQDISLSNDVQSLVAAELGRGDTRADIVEFLDRNHISYDIDVRNNKYVGVLNQSKMDLFFKRKVVVNLAYDPDTELFVGSRIVVHYAWL